MAETRAVASFRIRPPTWPGLRVDEVGLEARAKELRTRSWKRGTKLAALERAISMTDLTTLEGADTPGRVRRLCRRALQPDAESPLPPVAAVCVYPALVPVAAEALAGTPVAVASVATGFPSGQSPLGLRLEETKAAVQAGADEIDVVISRNAFLRGDLARVRDEVRAFREAAAPARLKVILETGELGSFDRIAEAAWIALEEGADFIKTSTGKVARNATPATALLMFDVVREFERATGRALGVKAAGGIRKARDALHYLALLVETLGPKALTNRRFRFGASSLLDDLVRQWRKQKSGRYQAPEDVTKD